MGSESAQHSRGLGVRTVPPSRMVSVDRVGARRGVGARDTRSCMATVPVWPADCGRIPPRDHTIRGPRKGFGGQRLGRLRPGFPPRPIRPTILQGRHEGVGLTVGSGDPVATARMHSRFSPAVRSLSCSAHGGPGALPIGLGWASPAAPTLHPLAMECYGYGSSRLGGLATLRLQLRAAP